MLLCLLAAVIWGGRLGAQSLLYLRHQSWSTEDGPPQDSVHQVLQSRDGFLWIATEGGLARYDGVTFRTFHSTGDPAFHSDDICCLAQDEDGSLWVGTADGLLRLRAGQFERFDAKSGLPSATVSSLFTPAGGPLLVLAGAELVAWRRDHFERVPGVPGDLRGMQPVDAASVLLLGHAKNLLLKDGRMTALAPEIPVEAAPLAGMVEAPDGAIWSYSTKDVSVRAGELSRRWRAGVELPGSRVQSLFVNRDGMAWVGTNDGLAVLSRDSPRAVPVSFLPGKSVLQTMQDREGNYWIGTETSGLHVLRPVKFRNVAGLADRALTGVVQATDGAVWVGTRSDGLRRIRGEMVEEPVVADRLTSPVILSLAPGAKGSVWAGTPDGLNHVEADGTVVRVTSAEGLPDDYIQALSAAPDGSVWVGTRHGLVHLRAGRMETFSAADGLIGDVIGGLLLTEAGDLWISTSGGLCRRGADGSIQAFAGQTGLPRGIVTAMTQDQAGAIWIAVAGHGLSRFAGGEFHPVGGLGFPERIDGLSADDRGYLWIQDEPGVQRVLLADLIRCAAAGGACVPDIARYGPADGLPTKEVVSGGSPALWRMADGELWFATRRGAAIVDPGHLPFDSVPPPVVMERFTVDESPVDLPPPEQSGGPIRIAPGAVRYTMEYAGLSFTAPAEVRYRFRLEGLDPGWTDAGSRRSATYTNLRPGAYTFRVQAMNHDGVWNLTGASLSFRVDAPFYRRWWFLGLVLLGLGTLSVWLYRLRVRRLRMRFDAVLRERNRVAREIHDTLAQDFVGVSLQLDLVSQLLGSRKVEDAFDQVQRTRQLVTDGLADARRSIWELRANLAQDSLPTRLSKVVARYTDDSRKLRLRIGGAYRALSPQVEDEVLRIAQEALSNVQRHSGANSATVELLYGSDMLVLTVEDDGRGFAMDDASSVGGHYGVSGMKERAALLGASLSIVSAPGAGTKIVLSAAISGPQSASVSPAASGRKES